MITEEQYSPYIRDFNESCAGEGIGFAAFFDKWYEPDATCEYLPKAAKNSGKEKAVAFWTSVSEIMRYGIILGRWEGQEWETSGTVHCHIATIPITRTSDITRDNSVWTESHAYY
jgi:hypothetical protein